MPPTRILRPVLGVSSQLFQQQCFNGVASAAFGWSVLTAATLRTRASKPSICPSCSFHLSRQLRFSSSKPPEPPNFDHLKPEEKSEQQPNFDHLRPIEDRPEPPFSSTQSDTTTSTSSPPPDATPDASTAESSPETSFKDGAESSLPSQAESQRSTLSTAFTSFMDQAQSKLFLASRRINDLTGYSGIETLKDQITNLETSLSTAQETLRLARNDYKVAVSDRSATQREVTTLLARQKTWTPADFERFTALYRTDYELEASVAQRARELEEAEREAERLGRELSAGILARYHEEQIWSDKIRRMSTWGTWGLMGVNILLFFMFQFGAEPWRRARLVKGFEEKVREALEHEREKEKAERLEVLGSFFNSSSQNAATAETTLVVADTNKEPEAEAKNALPTEEPAVVEETPAVADTTPISWREILTSTAWWRETASDLTSERKVAIRMRDVSLLALEGAAAGAAVAGTIAVFFLRRT
ncbi:putative Mdm33 family-domain-containing protein [Seiridium cardinale]|uniref:Sensitive to high expression protein 9, mitochondrial n=1 Tax=Seiridium cardinale TaxID=138064 RepID=A0ABR2X8W0_9PEZI